MFVDDDPARTVASWCEKRTNDAGRRALSEELGDSKGDLDGRT